MKHRTAEQVRDLIRAQANGNQAAWALQHELSPTYVSDVLTGRREPGRRILNALNLERVMLYRERTA